MEMFIAGGILIVVVFSLLLSALQTPPQAGK
jgi:hypothetical protein